LLDDVEGEEVDPHVSWLWTVAIISREFGVLPSVAARDLDSDPRRLSIACIYLLQYAEAKGAFDAAKDDKALEPWKGNKMMNEVRRNSRDLGLERRDRNAAARHAKRGKR
jgi:hypothetical protein